MSTWSWWSEIQPSAVSISNIYCEKTRDTGVGESLMDPLASLSIKLLKSVSGTMRRPRGSSAFIHIVYNSPSESVKSSIKHLRLKNWSHSIFTLSFDVSILNAWIKRLFTSINLSASEVVFSMNTLSVIEGPLTCTAAFYFSSPPSPSCPSSLLPSFYSLSLSSSCIVMRDQNSASS